jgi:hypothetical protein
LQLSVPVHASLEIKVTPKDPIQALLPVHERSPIVTFPLMFSLWRL